MDGWWQPPPVPQEKHEQSGPAGFGSPQVPLALPKGTALPRMRVAVDGIGSLFGPDIPGSACSVSGAVPAWAAGAAQDSFHADVLQRVAIACGAPAAAAALVVEDPWWYVQAPADEMYSSAKVKDKRGLEELYGAYSDTPVPDQFPLYPA